MACPRSHRGAGLVADVTDGRWGYCASNAGRQPPSWASGGGWRGEKTPQQGASFPSTDDKSDSMVLRLQKAPHFRAASSTLQSEDQSEKAFQNTLGQDRDPTPPSPLHLLGSQSLPRPSPQAFLPPQGPAKPPHSQSLSFLFYSPTCSIRKFTGLA